MSRPADIIPLVAKPATSLEERSDDELVRLARGGMSAAFDQLVRRHQDPALRIAAKWLGDPTAAKDAVQNAFEQVYRTIDRYRCEDRFRPYLYQIVINECRMTRRSSARRQRHLGGLESQASAPADRESEELILAREQRREVEAALARLGDKLRDVLVLRFAGDCSYQEIAAALDIPVGTVKSRLFAGLEKLRHLLDGEDAR
jgi:RNA polymerase sigma-70 factor (ECF subfamily)